MPALAVTGPDKQTFGPGSSQMWSIGPTDATTGIAGVRCSVVRSGQPASFGVCSGQNASETVSNLAEGNYALTVRATDAAGNITDVSRASPSTRRRRTLPSSPASPTVHRRATPP